MTCLATFYSDVQAIYCDFERTGSCPLVIVSQDCAEDFQLAEASSLGALSFNDSSLGNGKEQFNCSANMCSY